MVTHATPKPCEPKTGTNRCACIVHRTTLRNSAGPEATSANRSAQHHLGPLDGDLEPSQLLAVIVGQLSTDVDFV